MDELEAIQHAEAALKFADYKERADTAPVVIPVQVLRALIARATRSHD